MSLSAHEQHALHSIEDSLCVSDPELASLLATFSRLTAGEDMPVREKSRARRGSVIRRSRRNRRRRLGGIRRPPASRSRRYLVWQGAGLVLGLVVAAGIVAGALALTGLRPGW